eukprot:223473_1
MQTVGTEEIKRKSIFSVLRRVRQRYPIATKHLKDKSLQSNIQQIKRFWNYCEKHDLTVKESEQHWTPQKWGIIHLGADTDGSKLTIDKIVSKKESRGVRKWTPQEALIEYDM